ncbi:MAG: BtpA/SgcQ family protein [Candidatus Tectimicrobiota bacterium]
MTFHALFPTPKPLLACLHLLPLPGSPQYGGSMRPVYDTALAEAALLARYPIAGLIVENFRDIPFYPRRLPPETVAALATVTRAIVKATSLPVGVNALRNDAQAALAVATAAEAHFIRVNVHMGAVVSDQGIIQGRSHETLRLRAALRAAVLIFVDVGVKHATPLTPARSLAMETRDVSERGLADAVIVSGEYTGAATSLDDIATVRQHTHLPVLIGSGSTPENLPATYPLVDGFIVGSAFKQHGRAENQVEEGRVRTFMAALQMVRAARP